MAGKANPQHPEYVKNHEWRPSLITEYGSLITVRCIYCAKRRLATSSEQMIFHGAKHWGWEHSQEEVEALRVAYEKRAETGSTA